MTNVPGSNLLNQALTLIAKQSFTYFAQLSRSVLDNGQFLSAFAAGQPVLGSVQPQPRALNEKYGLTFQQSLWMFYLSQDIVDVTRDVSGDQFQFQGKTFQCLSVTPWFGIDGWSAVAATLIGGVKAF